LEDDVFNSHLLAIFTLATAIAVFVDNVNIGLQTANLRVRVHPAASAGDEPSAGNPKTMAYSLALVNGVNTPLTGRMQSEIIPSTPRSGRRHRIINAAALAEK
jgi:hypothetical protein